MSEARILPDQRVVDVAEGESLLDASLRAKLPHTHVCGGTARCSPCGFGSKRGSSTAHRARRRKRRNALGARVAVRRHAGVTLPGKAGRHVLFEVLGLQASS